MKNFNDLIADPSFQLGASILGQSGNPNAMRSALENMRAINQLKQERELAQQRLAQEGSYQQGELGLGKERNTIAKQQYERENAMTQQQIDRMIRQQTMQENFFRAIAPKLGMDPTMFGGQQPVQPPSPQAPPIPPAAMPGGAPPRFVPQLPGGAQIEQIPTPPAQPFRGGNPAQSYPTSATPASILDNLAQVESSGNPRAVNPQSGAMGMYQFMPQTVAALRKQGITFDPFNPQQARQAADFYLAQLYGQHGSWEKALAAYGGFKTKDPTNYVSRVMAGTAAPPAQQTGAQAQPMPNPGLDLAQIGAAAAMMGIPGGTGLIEVGKMQQPQNVPAGSYQRNPVTGETSFVGNPYEEKRLGIQQQELGLKGQDLALKQQQQQYEMGGGAAGMSGKDFSQAKQQILVKRTEETQKQYEKFQNAPEQYQALLDARESLKHTNLVGIGRSSLVSSLNFLNNTLGLGLNPANYQNAEVLQRNLAQAVVTRLRQMDQNPTAQQQKYLQKVVGDLTTDPKALEKIIQFQMDVIQTNVNKHNSNASSLMKMTDNATGDLTIKLPEEPHTAIGTPKVGDVRKGYVYMGGDPASPQSWKPAPKGK